MDDLSDLISPDAALTGVAVPNKKALFQQLAATAASQTGLDARVIVERLLERLAQLLVHFGRKGIQLVRAVERQLEHARFQRNKDRRHWTSLL